MLFIYLALIVVHIEITKLHELEKQNDNIPYYARRLKYADPVNTGPMRYFRPSKDDGQKTDNNDARRLLETRTLDDLDNHSGEVFSSEDDFSRDVNERRRIKDPSDFRRNVKTETRLYQKRMYHSSRSVTGVTSTSVETKEFKEEWLKRWNELKEDALSPKNRLIYNFTKNQKFAMVAARPWFKPCGDPALHDVPWGTCTLPYECEGEYRIYRGDIGCGRTQLVCCAIESFRQDMNAAFDVSFADTSLFSTSSEEVEKLARGSKENRHRKRLHKKMALKVSRRRQKRIIKKLIRRLGREIRKQLNRAFRNDTVKRITAITNLKTLIKAMKSKFKNQRKKAVKKNNEYLVKLSDNLVNKLNHMRDMNVNFLINGTFREIVVNGTINRGVAKQLLRAYPELIAYPELSEILDSSEIIQNKTRRMDNRMRKRHKPRDYLQYEIDYGPTQY